MGFSVGIVGLPNVGKSTLFKALTKKQVNIAPYPFTTIDPNIGIVEVPDERLEKIAKIINPEKVTKTTIEFVDIAGLVKGAHKGEGLGNQFLAQIRNCDAVLIILRGFEKEDVENVLGEVDPNKEWEILKTELLMKDLETLENAISNLKSKIKSKEKSLVKKYSLLNKLKEEVAKGKLISEVNLSEEEKEMTKEFQFLTQKPMIFIVNGEKNFNLNFPYLLLNLKDEEEISELSEREQKELGLFSKLDQLILKCYNILDLITFYTIAKGKEAKAWTIKRGTKAIEAAGKVHTDFKEKFICAEVIYWEKLIEAGSLALAKQKGLIQIVGKDYILRDGDIIEFKI
jgi:GTP-binding protein YchF